MQVGKRGGAERGSSVFERSNLCFFFLFASDLFFEREPKEKSIFHSRPTIRPAASLSLFFALAFVFPFSLLNAMVRRRSSPRRLRRAPLRRPTVRGGFGEQPLSHARAREERERNASMKLKKKKQPLSLSPSPSPLPPPRSPQSQSKKRGFSLEEKRQAVLGIFHDSADVFVLKVSVPPPPLFFFN